MSTETEPPAPEPSRRVDRLGRSMVAGGVALIGVVDSLVAGPDALNNKPALAAGLLLYAGGTAVGMIELWKSQGAERSMQK